MKILNKRFDPACPIDSIKPHPRNAREGDCGAIYESIQENGFWGTVLVQESTGYILAGSHRYRSMGAAGSRVIPAIFADVDDETALRIMLADNRTSDLASYDMNALAELVESVRSNTGLQGSGWDDESYQNLLDDLAGLQVGDLSGGEAKQPKEQASDRVEPQVFEGPNAVVKTPNEPEAEPAPAPVKTGNCEDDDAPEAEESAPPVSRPGDIWICGQHRVLNGDSTSREQVLQLFAGAVPEVVFSDPPYGIKIVKGSKVGGGGPVKFGKVGGKIVEAKTYAEIANDDSTDVARRFHLLATELGVKHSILWSGNYFTDFLTPSMCWIVWDKQNTGNFADVELAWTSFERGAKLYPWLWNGMSRAGDRATELVSRVHPTQKPVGLFVKIFQDFNFTTCFDGFLGSGSTLIACEKTSRICYGIELSSAYVDVIVKRWQTFTGQHATLEGDGRTFEQIAQDRTALPKAA